MSLVIDPESSTCGELQRMGTMCGCPSALHAGEKPCSLCENNNIENITLDMLV